MTNSKSWRDVLPIHPAAELFPLMSPDELAALGEDIRKHGLTSSIVLWSDGKSQALLLDGRSRLDAIEREIGPAIVGAPSITAGKDFLAINKVIVLDRSVDPYAYVISANIHRRHLTAEQKRELIAKLIEADPSKSDRQIAETVKASPTTVGTVRAEMEAKGDVSKLDTRTDSLGRQQLAHRTICPPNKVIESLDPQIGEHRDHHAQNLSRQGRALSAPERQSDLHPPNQRANFMGRVVVESRDRLPAQLRVLLRSRRRRDEPEICASSIRPDSPRYFIANG